VIYIVIKVIKGRRYRYQQRTYREGRRVRTESRYLGPADGPISPPVLRRRRRTGLLGKLGDLIAANMLSPEEKARIVDEDALLREVKAEEAAREKAKADFEAQTGMRLGPANPTPVEKPPSSIDLARLETLPTPDSEVTKATSESDVATAPTEGPADGAAGPEGSE
jgi:hypothetical protein